MEKDLLRLLQACVGAVVLLGTAVLFFSLFPAMNSDVGAAWVQAVGSIAAILGSAWIARHQTRESQKLEKWKEDQRESKILLAVISTLSIAHAICSLLQEAISEEGPVHIDKTNCDRLLDARAVIERIPLMEIAFPKIAISLAVLPRTLMQLEDLLRMNIGTSNLSPTMAEALNEQFSEADRCLHSLQSQIAHELRRRGHAHEPLTSETEKMPASPGEWQH